MAAVKDFIVSNPKSVGAGVCAVGAALFIWKKFSKGKQRVCGVDYPKDTVILHHFLKGENAPSLGHFVMKLETYLRITKIPYKIEYGLHMGPKEKVPWIEYNGITMGDSQLIINFLNKEFNVDLNKSLSKEDRAVAWAIQKWIEEFTYHLNVYTKWCLHFDEFTKMIKSIPSFMMYPLSKRVYKMQYAVGTARHSADEVHEMMVFDMQQLSTIIGDKKFAMGTDGPTELDCAIFGIITQVRWHTPDSCPGKQLLLSDLTNVMAYLDRIKRTYWPDWNDLLASSSKDA